MRIFDLFFQNGDESITEGNKSQLLDDPHWVWMVGKGTVSVFLTALTADNQPGERRFLFSAEPGSLLFGIKPEGQGHQQCLLASGTIGATLVRMEADVFYRILHHKKDAAVLDEAEASITLWQKALASAGAGISAAGGPTAASPLPSENNEVFNTLALTYFIAQWEREKSEEGKRLTSKYQSDQRRMSQSIERLAEVVQRPKNGVRLEEPSGVPLLDACCLVAKYMHIEINAEAMKTLIAAESTTLDDVSTAAFFRTREIRLTDRWYLEDNGPILASLKDSDTPVALIPLTAKKYRMHDFSNGTVSHVTAENASKMNSSGHIFYRPFPCKPINLLELLTFSHQSFWKKDLIIIILLGIAGGILGTAIPLASGIVFSAIIPEGDTNQLLQIAFFLGASALASMLFQFTRAVAMLRIEGKMECSIQAAVWDRLLSLPVPFFKQFAAGELAMRAMGISQARTILTGVTLNAILSGVFSVFSFALLFYYDGNLAWVATLLVTANILVMGVLNLRQVRYERKVLEASNGIAGLMLQIIGGINKFRVAGAQRRAFYQWAHAFVEQRNLTFKKEMLGNHMASFNAFFSVIAITIIYYTLTTTDSSLSPGEFIGFNAAFISFMFSLTSLLEALISANGVIPLYQRAKPILEAVPEYDESKLKPEQLTGSIEVSNVSFRYKEDGPLILEDISFRIDKGDYVALVGASGSGKSTLLRVLLGFEKPEAGSIYYNGQDLNKIDIRSVRKQLGVVLQNGQLMSSSIFRNIVGANAWLTIDDAWEAARMAGMEEEIKEMPMGMHTIISEGAGTISGGQRQRLLIARAIIHKPQIIYFDEATSALDNTTQDVVVKSLNKLRATRIVIAHRLSTISHCNKIIVMDKGRIAETGSYQELMDKNGLFADIAKRQLA